MKMRLMFLGLILLAGCSAEPGTPSSGDEEPPFFNVHRNGTGPLTLEELQINIPKKLDVMYTDTMRSCLVTKIGELAAEAGDPETLDPADVAFLPTDGTWEELTRYGKRTILAQAIVSRAASLC